MRLGRLIPWTIIVSFALDAATRLVPLDAFSFRAWETVSAARGPTGPFEPNRSYAKPRTYGDLARSWRYRGLRRLSPEAFSTDAWGFRNTADQPGPVRWLLVGDSFGVGSGVRDESTLASQIAALSGERVYNASADHPLSLPDIQFTASRLGMRGGTVVYEFMERQDMPAPDDPPGRQFGDGPPRAADDPRQRWRTFTAQARVSRLAILADRAWDAMATSMESTGEGASSGLDLRVASRVLLNGQSMLFLGADDDAARDSGRRFSPDYLVWLDSELARSNLRLLVLLVPTKSSVYGPLTREGAAPASKRTPFSRLAEALRSRGVSVVDSTEALKARAAVDLSRNQYVYFIDDTHWNERGIEIAARALVSASRDES